MRRGAMVATAIAGAALLMGVGSGVAIGRSFPTETVERTPQSCIEVLHLAAQVIDNGSEMVRIATDAIEATRNDDNYTLAQLSDQMGALKQKAPIASQMSALEADCKAKAK